MLNQPTLQKLQTLRLHGMAEAFRVQWDPAQRDGLADLSFEERFALLVDQEWTWRPNRARPRPLAPPFLDAELRLGRRASEYFLVGLLWGREKLARLRSG